MGMPKIIVFLVNLARKCGHDPIMERGAGLTFRVLLAFFPFLVFMMSLVGFLQLDESAVMRQIYTVLPGDVAGLVDGFIGELGLTRSRGLLSASLFFSVYNTANGFRAIIRSANRAYGVDDPRGPVRRVGLSLTLMLLFTLSIFVMVGVLVFGGNIGAIMFPHAPGAFFTVARAAGSLGVLVFTTMLIYKLSCAERLTLGEVFPGAALTVMGWAAASGLFGFFVTNFTQYPAVYGSIAGVFILILWLNLICVILLVGNEFNALLRETRQSHILT
jgi:membrane protein